MDEIKNVVDAVSARRKTSRDENERRHKTGEEGNPDIINF
jgi:hypothetical protein